MDKRGGRIMYTARIIVYSIMLVILLIITIKYLYILTKDFIETIRSE